MGARVPESYVSDPTEGNQELSGQGATLNDCYRPQADVQIWC
jgi:hypothetical protein